MRTNTTQVYEFLEDLDDLQNAALANRLASQEILEGVGVLHAQAVSVPTRLPFRPHLPLWAYGCGRPAVGG